MEAANVLLAHQRDIDAKDGDGQTALALAVHADDKVIKHVDILMCRTWYTCY